MAFHRPHPKRISHEPVSNRELELEQVNQALRDELSNEVSINKSNEKYINELEHKYTQCEKEIQSLNKELEWLDNALEEEKAELRSEIASLKRSLYQAKKEIRDKVSYTDIIEKQLQESEERVQNLRLRFKIISSRRSSPILYNSEEDTDMAHIDPFINITRGLNRLENHFTGGTPLINPVNIIQGMYGTLNTIRANYQRIDQDLDDVTNQRDARDAQIVQLQQDVNYFRQQNIALQNHVNQLTLERNNSQNDLALMTTAYYNEREERRHLWRVAKQLEKGMQMRINTLLLDKLALNFKLRRCQRHGRELQQGPNIPHIPQKIVNKSQDHLETIAMRLGYPDDESQNPDDLANFIEYELYNRLGYENYNLRKEPFGSRRNSPVKKVYTNKKSSKTSSKCSDCDDPSEEESDNEKSYYESEEEDDNSRHTFALKKKITKSGSKKKSQSKKPSSVFVIQKIFRASCKSLIEALIKECPENILVEALSYLGNVYDSLKNTLLDNYASKYSSKEKEVIWGQVTEVYKDILHSLIVAVDRINKSKEQPQSNTLNFAIKKHFIQQTKKSYWPDPRYEINFIHPKDPDDVATITSKVASMTIPYSLVDSGSNESVISDNIAEEMGLEIDKSNIPNITGLASNANVVGTSYNVPVTISDGKNSITAYDNFSIVKAEKNKNGDYKSLVLFGNPLLSKLGWEPIVNREFKACQNDVHVTLPLSVHKSQREIFTTEKLEPWHAPEGFNPKKN
ncbi:15098_t:CDS:2 [Entrophospora sp. SA101]|nr:15098_t:CDS:2 [Entrophospora sp. SA101]